MKLKLHEINEKVYSSKQDFVGVFYVGKNKYSLIQKQEDERAGHTLIVYEPPETEIDPDGAVPCVYINWQGTNAMISMDSFHGLEALMYLRQKDLEWFQEYDNIEYTHYFMGFDEYVYEEMKDIFNWEVADNVKTPDDFTFEDMISDYSR